MKSKSKSAAAIDESNPVRTDAYVTSEMAGYMLRYGEGCTREQLEMHFTADEIERLGAAARAEANSRAGHRIAA